MAKLPASTSLEADLMERIVTLARVEKRSQAQILEMCIEKGLPGVEAELAAPKVQETPTHYGKSDSRVREVAFKLRKAAGEVAKRQKL